MIRVAAALETIVQTPAIITVVIGGVPVQNAAVLPTVPKPVGVGSAEIMAVDRAVTEQNTPIATVQFIPA